MKRHNQNVRAADSPFSTAGAKKVDREGFSKRVTWEDSMAATFGNIIRDRRRQLNLTQREVANRIGTSTPYVGHLESGKRHPSERILTRLADTLGFDRRELFFLANPNSEVLFGQTSVPAPRNSAWEVFCDSESLHRLHQITAREMHMLSQVALMGQVRSPRDFIYILNTVRQSLAA